MDPLPGRATDAVTHRTFRAHERMKGRDNFSRARRRGRRWSGRFLVLWAFRREEVPARAARLGPVVSRQHGGAAQRNLFKRRLREIFRQKKPPRGWDLVITAKHGIAPFPPSHREMERDYTALTARLSSGENAV
ncbi:MAG: ribonuclease P protein component [Elusimicrobia bacterium]|nr:ribonuclease P protein component [Elusimicrobiota bacterium]MBK7207590.1 ribonuclease P protein component [Elusimicrobiota bacterium]MBK7544360.1 ribonuclease P protein component [Elusimicrobiota bacterium]MBK7573882.1 ribonuclease P protein component [Elusimicrobiota bacterium]MBK8126025.1 ribonuclease P protein component [Elusimicrobiota bacterium]